jgi:hypothetical protein
VLFITTQLAILSFCRISPNGCSSSGNPIANLPGRFPRQIWFRYRSALDPRWENCHQLDPTRDPNLCRGLEPFEAQSQAVAIGVILLPARRVQVPAIKPLEGLQHWTVFLDKQALGNMQPIVRVDADQMRVESCMMDLRKRNAVRHHGLAEALVTIRNDVGSIEQQWLGQTGKSTAPPVGRDDCLTE